MFQAVSKDDSRNPDSARSPSSASRLFCELLDSNHDAWRVFHSSTRWVFYREVGDKGGALPAGSVVLTSEVGRRQTLDLYSVKGRRSLLTSYGDELPQAVQHLIDRERVIALFSKLASHHDPASWDHNLSFAGAEVTERRVALRSSSSAYERLVGDAKARMSVSPAGSWRALSPALAPGIRVTECDGFLPLIEYSLTYPRPLSGRFFSSRLRDGLYAITNQMVSLVVAHNRGVEGDRHDFGYGGWD